MKYSLKAVWVFLSFIALTGHADEVLKWNSILLNAVRSERMPPPRASRAMAVVHVAVFDAVNAIDQSYESYQLNVRGDKNASKQAAASSAAHQVLVDLFPLRKSALDGELENSLSTISEGAMKSQGIELGRTSAQLILDLRRNDNGTTWGSVPAPGPGVWEATPPAYAPGAFPGWGRLSPWTMTSGAQFRGQGPADLKTGEYTKAFNEVKRLGKKNSSSRTVEQTEIALFWADGPGTATPPGHWNEIAKSVSKNKGLSLVENARLFALLNLAVADAAIAAWDMKYFYFNWRPITAIQRADTDGNKHTEADLNWEPLIPTPSFPDYVSGHSTFSEASAEILKLFFRTDNIHFSTTSDDLPTVVRHFSKFSEAADEAGLSRIYGGIHFAFADKDAQMAGRKLAHQIFTKYLRKK